MKEKRESRVPVERVTDAEIASAIRYLDPGYAQSEGRVDRTDAVLVLCASLILLLAGALGFILLYLRAS
jgi:hypothetical protein